MKVRVSDIPEEGLAVEGLFDPIERRLQTEEIRFPSPLTVSALFHKEKETVYVHVRARGRMTAACGRCLKLFEEPYAGEFDLDYAARGELTLDITDDVRGEILLSYPVKLLCRQECQGLCIRCGADLNEGECGCPPQRE